MTDDWKERGDTSQTVSAQFATESASNAAARHRLKTIDEHNREVQRQREVAKLTGISCPACTDAELSWPDNRFSQTSYPPQYAVHCPGCGWSGFVEG